MCLAIEAADSPGVLLGEVVLKWLPGRGGRDRLGPGAGSAGKGHRHGSGRRAAALGFEDLGFHRTDAKLDALNTASAALCERLGMRLESSRWTSGTYKGEWATEVVYAILEDEWKSRQPS